MKKISALILAVIMMMTMTAFASEAEDMTGKAGVIGDFTNDTPAVKNDVVIIHKEITALNPETCEVNAPTITYTYEIKAGEAGKTITDALSHHVKINDTYVNVSVTTKAGVGASSIKITGTTTSNSTNNNKQLAITPADKLNASEFGTANRFPIEIDFSDVDFTTAGSGAGVYRYVIDETCTVATKNAAGIAEGAVANTLYMDVYVDGNGEIYGYVLFTNNIGIDASPDKDSDAATTAGKIEGFVGSKSDGEAYTEDDSAADKYYTFNLDLTKVVENDAYAKSNYHQFPFTVTLENTSVTANVLPIMTVGTHASQTALTAAPIAGTWNPTIADGATVSYVGIPCGTTITVCETNDVTGVTYTSVSTNADTNAVAKSINTDDVSNNAIISCGATALNVATENHTTNKNKKVTFTNTLLQISPTGVVLRVAPYVLMLAAGIVLVVLAMKRRKANVVE